MSGFRILAVMMAAAASLAFAHAARASPVRSERVACAVAKATVAAQLHRSLSRIPWCDTVIAAYRPRGYYIIGLHGRCIYAEGCGSTLIGWYAVSRRTGRVFDWDVAEERLGAAIAMHP